MKHEGPRASHTRRAGTEWRTTEALRSSCANVGLMHNLTAEGNHRVRSADVSSRSECEYTKEDANDYRIDANGS